MQYILLVIFFLFGTMIGSFLVVIVSRYNTGLSPWRGRSFCFSCSNQLERKDLFPIFSFLFLKGRCRYCFSKIPKDTIIIEILMGFLSVLAACKLGLLNPTSSIIYSSTLFTINISYFILQYFTIVSIFATILALSIYDLRHFIIPDSFLVTFFFLSFLHNLLFILYNSTPLISYLALLTSGIVLALPFLLVFIFSRGRWIGFGDVKYIFVIGIFLGFVEGVSAVIISFWIGAAFSLILLLLKFLLSQKSLPIFSNNLTIKSEIPFGPFLSLGIIISFYFNVDILQIRYLLQSF